MARGGGCDIELGAGYAVEGRAADERASPTRAMAEGMSGFALPEDITPGLEETHYFGAVAAAYCNGTHLAEAEVDIETGHIRICSYVVGHDCGCLINPLIVEGHIQGGVAHGVGNALFEWMGYDDDARPLTTTLATSLPVATDVPDAVMHPYRDAVAAQPARRQGRGRGRHDPGRRRGRRRGRGRARALRHRVSDAPMRPERLCALLAAAGAYG